MLKFLHLSDLHITTTDAGSQFDRDVEIRDRLLDDLGTDGRDNFDAILVTGDVAYHGQKAEYERASIWFDQVCKKTGVSPESFFVVPGNHDVNQLHVRKKSIMWDAHQQIRSVKREAEREIELKEKLQDSSWNFLKPLDEYRDFSAIQGRLSSTSSQELAWVSPLPALDDGTKVLLHGLNSAFLSDSEDEKANLLVSPFQFKHLAQARDSVNIVMCHHPSSWLLDGDNVEDRYRQHAHLILTGHEHKSKCFPVGNGLRVCAGAVHPSRGEDEWNPGYNVIRMHIDDMNLVTEVETRVWHKTNFKFVRQRDSDISDNHTHRQKLSIVASKPTLDEGTCGNSNSVVSSMPSKKKNASIDVAFAIARRKLVIHFFRIGSLARLKVAMEVGVWEEEDENLTGQARWAKVFDRAEKNQKFADLWDAVAAEDASLSGENNPFKTAQT